jgi:hypothetical protein
VRTASRLHRLETQVQGQRATLRLHPRTSCPIISGDLQTDAFLYNVGCTRPFLNPAWYERAMMAVVDALADGDWQNVHDSLHPRLESRMTWQELNVVLLRELEEMGFLERRLASGGYWHEVRLRTEGEEAGP